jgi:type II secretory pathway component PulF
MAIFIFPFAEFFRTGDWIVYGAKTLGILVPIYLFVVLIVYACQSQHGEKWRSWIESLLRPIPVLGTARFYLSVARLCAALEALLSAGVTVIQAWEMAATASASPALRRTVESWHRQLEAGCTHAELVSASARFPELFIGQYAAGEISGKLEDTLKRMHQYYQEEGSRKLRAIAQWSPRAVYLLIALLIAYKVVKFWTNYYSNMQGF